MERGCTTATGNVYYESRKAAAIHNDKLNSREGAAELLGVSASTLAHYELSVCKVVPPDAVVMMADLYNAPELNTHYCANECPIGRRCFTAPRSISLEQATINLLDTKHSDESVGIEKMLLKIAKAGAITKDNLEQVETVLEYFGGLSQAICELKLSCQKLMQTNQNKEEL